MLVLFLTLVYFCWNLFKFILILLSFKVFQDPYDMGVSLDPNTTIINIWKSWGNGWERELADVTSDGFRAVLAAPWYLNYIEYGSDWVSYYQVDPTDFIGTLAQKSRVLGGEICIWGEFVNSINVTPRLWPRASAAAEVLWSIKKDPITVAAARLQEHECRMMTRGFPVQPVVGPGFCPGHLGL